MPVNDEIAKQKVKEGEEIEGWYHENLRAPIRHRHEKIAGMEDEYESVYYRTSKFQGGYGNELASHITPNPEKPEEKMQKEKSNEKNVSNIVQDNKSEGKNKDEILKINQNHDKKYFGQDKDNEELRIDQLGVPVQEEFKEGLEWSAEWPGRLKNKHKRYGKGMYAWMLLVGICGGMTGLLGWRMYYYYYSRDKMIKTKTNHLWKTLMANKSTKSLLSRAECHTS